MNKARAREKLGAVIQRAREAAGLSRDDVAKKCDISTRTVQNWECGYSTPDFIHLLALCEAIKISPIRLTNNYYFPDFQPIETQHEDQREELINLCKQLSAPAVEALMYILTGDHGSDPFAILQLAVADLHCPLWNRYMIAHQTAANYRYARLRGELVCPDTVQPAMGVLDAAIEKGREAAMCHETRYHSDGQPLLLLRDKEG